MCLTLSIKLSEEDAPDAARLARLFSVAGDEGEVLIEPVTGWFGKKTPYMGVGCACDLLTDDADWNASTWEMHPSLLSQLAEGLQSLRNDCEHGFQFEALWVGDKPEEVKTVSIEEMLRIVRESKIGTKTQYRIE